jgi:hypothetical protein
MITIIGVLIMAVTLIMLRKVVEGVVLPLTPEQKNARIRRAGKLRRVCEKHSSFLVPGNMAVVDLDNCDMCKMENKNDYRI